jgi:hypothetical protein
VMRRGTTASARHRKRSSGTSSGSGVASKNARSAAREPRAPHSHLVSEMGRLRSDWYSQKTRALKSTPRTVPRTREW